MLRLTALLLLKPFLKLLEILFQIVRKTPDPTYPYDKKLKIIQLPKHIEHDLKRLVSAGRKAEAVKKVAELTGAGLRVSKDYVDGLNR